MPLREMVMVVVCGLVSVFGVNGDVDGGCVHVVVFGDVDVVQMVVCL